MSPISATGTREEMGTTKWGTSRTCCCLQCAFVYLKPLCGHGVVELSWLQQKWQDNLLHGMLVQRPLVLWCSGDHCSHMCLQKEPREHYPSSRIKSFHQSKHQRCKETFRAAVKKVWAIQLGQSIGFGLQVSSPRPKWLGAWHCWVFPGG